MLSELFPRGPWPGLIVLHSHDHIEWDRSIFLRIPGPVDERLFTVFWNGGHFDPACWQDTDGYSATCPNLPAPFSGIGMTLFANFGPGRGVLCFLGASYAESLTFLPSGSDQCTKEHASEALSRQGSWELWVQHIEHKAILRDISREDTAFVMLGCDHPCPLYPEIWSVAQGINMLAPQVRTVYELDSSRTSALIKVATLALLSPQESATL